MWTVDDEADIDLCLELGVDAIITNRPRAVLTAAGALTAGVACDVGGVSPMPGRARPEVTGRELSSTGRVLR